MAATKYPIPPELIASDLVVRIRPRDFTTWEGSSAQLKAEGLIPEGFEWPQGQWDRTWSSNRWHYWLRRCRPPGLKGPMRLWVNGDWWDLRRTRPCDQGSALIYERRQELEREFWRQSNRALVLKASKDKRFRAFMLRAMGR